MIFAFLKCTLFLFIISFLYLSDELDMHSVVRAQVGQPGAVSQNFCKHHSLVGYRHGRKGEGRAHEKSLVKVKKVIT